MDYKQRQKRLRLLVSKLNKERKTQARKIDIICNDLIAAQRGFIKRLDTIGFAADFYESILAATDLDSLLDTASRVIKDEIPDANIALFLRQAGSFELHISESDQPITLEKQRLENCFTPELVNNVCESNKLCTLDYLLTMGLQGNPAVLNKLSAVTIPLGQLSSSVGFILIYRSSDNKLTAAELSNVTAIVPGLSRAIASCRVLSKEE